MALEPHAMLASEQQGLVGFDPTPALPITETADSRRCADADELAFTADTAHRREPSMSHVRDLRRQYVNLAQPRLGSR